MNLKGRIATGVPSTADADFDAVVHRGRDLDAPTSARGLATTSFGDMSKISLIAKLTAADGKAEELEAALADVVASADEEAGLEIYSAHKANDSENTYYFFELYTDGDALAVHGKGDGMKQAMGAFGGLLAGRPEITMMTPVVAKGLDI